MQPAHVAGETTSGVHVAAPRHDAPPVPVEPLAAMAQADLLAANQRFERRHPGMAGRRDPVVLHHAARIGQALGPQALPVSGARVAPAGDDDDGDGRGHSTCILRAAP